MFIESTSYAFLQNVRTKLNEFKFIPQDVFSPNDNFEERFRQYVVKQDSPGDHENLRWVGAVWHYKTIRTPQAMGRPLTGATKDLEAYLGSKYWINYKDFQIDVSYFSSDIYYLTWFHEMFGIMFDRSVCLDVAYVAPMGTIKVNYLDITPSDISMVGREKYGSLCRFSFSTNVCIPIIRKVSEQKLIKPANPGDDPEQWFADVRINENIPDEYLEEISKYFLVI